MGTKVASVVECKDKTWHGRTKQDKAEQGKMKEPRHGMGKGNKGKQEGQGKAMVQQEWYLRSWGNQ